MRPAKARRSATRRERAILVGICRRASERPATEEHLDELGRLAETAGAAIVGRLLQDRGAVSPSTLLRSGKVEELHLRCTESEAKLVICDEDLSPAQVRNLEKALEVTVLDRSALILDIFARRARSREARTQVELAQLRYLLPRLTRQWTHLSRQAGGIGQRGVGETQLESDRRVIRRRIARLDGDLKEIETERRERRKARSSVPHVALVGYTNAGKSTIMNLLTGSSTLVEDRLFVTLDPLVRRCATPGGEPFLLIDTVGFIRKLPHHLVASFRSTLEEAADADLLLIVADASSPALGEHLVTARETLEGLGLDDRPSLVVLNKIDRVPAGEMGRLAAAYPEAIRISALDSEHGRRLCDAVRSKIVTGIVEEMVLIPAAAPDLLARLCSLVRVTGTEVRNGFLEVRFRSRPQDRALVERLVTAAGTMAEGR